MYMDYLTRILWIVIYWAVDVKHHSTFEQLLPEAQVGGRISTVG